MNSNQINQGLGRLFTNRIWWLTVAGIIGIFIYLRYDARVFPSASIDLKLPHAEIIHTARHLASELGYDKLTAIESTQFTVDQEAKTFLEYELGTDKANVLMKEDLPIWSWRTRFCQQHEQEEFRIWLSTAGHLCAFSHEIENDRKLPSLSQGDAHKLACQFIQDKTDLSLTSYNLIKSSSYTEAHRTDYSFTWEDNKRDFQGAKLRIQVGVAGNLIDQFNYFLYVPESFERKYSTLRSYNELLESIASIIYSLLQVVSVFVFFWAVSTKRIRWRFAILVASLATFVDLLESFNNISSVIDSYNTQKLFSGYLLEFVIQCLVGCLTKFISYLMLAGAAELMYRVSYPKKMACENLLSPNSYRTKTFINGNLIGHLLVGINLGWIVAYYLSGRWWHAWCPSGIDNYQVLNAYIPFFSAIATGIGAALNEEFLYRVLALSLCQRFTRSFWLANIFQAAAWGFMHSTYPQEPAYARGLELTMVGLMHGWILRRYGILPCLIGHYLFDALVSVKPLFGASDLTLKWSALIPIMPFFLLLVFTYLRVRKSGYINETSLQNRSLVKIAPRAAKSLIAQFKDELKHGNLAASKGETYTHTLAKKTALFLLSLGTICLLLILPFLNYQAINRETTLSLERHAIIASAKKELAQHKINANLYKVVATLGDETSPLDMQYAFEQLGLSKTLALAQVSEQGLFWRVRFCKALDPIEYEIWLDRNGGVVSFTLIEPEDTAGANLTETTAREKVEEYLKTKHPQWQPYKFENSFENKRKARTDYTFTFTIPHLAVKDAEFKVSVGVLGDVVSGFDAGYDLPDHWLNERNKRTAKDELLLQVRTAFSVILFLAALFWIFGLFKTGQIRWQLAYYCAVPLVIISLIQQLNNYPQFYHAYLTTDPLYSYIMLQATNCLQSVQSNFLYYFCGFALAATALYTVAPRYKLRSFVSFLLAPLNKQTAKALCSLWLSSWLIAFSVVSLHCLINAASDYFHSTFSPGCPEESLSTICSLANISWPWLAILLDAITNALSQLMLVGIFSGLYKRFCSGFTLYALFIIVFNLVTYSSARYWQDYSIDVTFSSLWEISLWFFIVKLIRVNPLAYCLIGSMDSLMSNLIDLLQHGWPVYAKVITVIISLFLSPLFYALSLWILSGKEKSRKEKPPKAGVG